MTIKANSYRRLRDPDGSPGQALAEMAFVLPVLLLLVFGIIEMSLAWRTSQIVTNVTREGARLAVLPEENNGTVTTHIESLLTAGGLPTTEEVMYTIILGCDDVVPGPICDQTETGHQVYVETRYPYQFRLLGPLVELAGGQGGPFGQIMISSTSTMRKE